MRKQVFIPFILSMLFSLGMNAQDDLLSEIEETATATAYAQPAFKAMKICNLQSTKLAGEGDLYLYVSHRFGSLKKAMDTFFGLDEANTNIQLVYGIKDWVQVGISRESLRKTFAGSAKVKLLDQENYPLNLVLYSTANYNTELEKSRYPNLKDEDRLSYATQLLISRRISNGLSLEFAPTFVRQNLVLEPFQKHEQMILAAGGRVKLTKRTSINIDYGHNLDRAKESIYNDPLAVGLDIETGGHVFQLLFSNSQSTNEPGFLSTAEGDWSEGDIFFGFNIVRVF